MAKEQQFTLDNAIAIVELEGFKVDKKTLIDMEKIVSSPNRKLAVDLYIKKLIEKYSK